MKRSTIVWVVAGVLALVAAGVIGWWVVSGPAGPSAAATAYLDALAAGDGDRAVALTRPADDLDRAAALDAATEHIADPVVAKTTASGDHAQATVSYTLGGVSQKAAFGLTRHDGVWIVDADALGVVEATTTLGPAVRVGGVVVPTGEAVSLFPALYTVEAAPAGIVTGATRAAVQVGGTVTAAVTASVSPSAATTAQIQLDAYAQHCALPGAEVPPNCGLRVPWAADLATLDTIAFRVEKLPQVTLSPDLTSFAATGGAIVATATGTTRSGSPASFTYRATDWALRGTVSLTSDGMQLAVD